MANEYEALIGMGFSDDQIFSDPNLSMRDRASLQIDRINSKAAGVIPQMGAGFVEGLGGMADLGSYLSPIKNPYQSPSETIQPVADYLAPQPTTEKEKAARIVGSFLVPDPVKKAQTGWGLAKALLKELPRNATIGLGAYATEDASPLIGALFAGTGLNALESGYNALSKTGAQRAAARTLINSGADPAEIKATLDANPANQIGMQSIAERTQSPALAQVEYGLSERPELAPLFTQRDQARQTLRDALFNSVKSGKELTPVAIGEMSRDAGAARKAGLVEGADSLFDAIDPANSTRIEASGAQEAAQNMVERLYGSQGLEPRQNVSRLVEALTSKDPAVALAGIENKSTTTKPFGVLRGLRTSALSAGRETASPKEAKIFGTIAEAIDGVITKAVEKGDTLSKAQLDKWKEARALWKQSLNLFKDNPAGKKLVNPNISAENLVAKVWDGSKRTAAILKDIFKQAPEAKAAFGDGILNLVKRDAENKITTHSLKSFIEKNGEGIAEYFGAERLNKLKLILSDKQSADSVRNLALTQSKGQSRTIQSYLLQKWLGGNWAEMALDYAQGVNPAARNRILASALLDPAKFDELLKVRTELDMSSFVEKLTRDYIRISAESPGEN